MACAAAAAAANVNDTLLFERLTERYRAKQVRARDEWHLAARWVRKFVSHTIAVLF